MPHEHLVSSCKKHHSYKRHTTDSMDPRSFAGSDGATWTESCALPWLWLGHQVGDDVILPPWYGCCGWMMMMMMMMMMFFWYHINFAWYVDGIGQCMELGMMYVMKSIKGMILEPQNHWVTSELKWRHAVPAYTYGISNIQYIYIDNIEVCTVFGTVGMQIDSSFFLHLHGGFF